MVKMRTLLSAILVLLVLPVFSQVKDTKAIALLDEVSAQTKACKSIKADFTYTMENKQSKVNESKSGTLLLSGYKYRLKAAGQEVICDGKTIWTFLKESNEVQINDLDNKDESLTPSKLLSNYNTNYKSKLLKDRASDDPLDQSIELIPNIIKNFTKAILVVDKVKKQVKSFILYDKSGNTFTYKITKYQTDLPVTPADFTFDKTKFPGVEINDMR